MATAIQPRGLQKYADGGFISKLFGPKETVTEKFARQDAEFKAKHPERFQAPAPTAQSAPAPTQGISGYVGNGALDKRMKAAGMKAGGMVKKCVTGGKITGEGGPTDDLVPIMASNGEFMIKASSAEVLGPKVLKALNAVGDGVKPKAPSGAIRMLADGGAVQVPTGPGMDREGFLARNPNVQQGGIGTAAPAPMAAPTVPAPAPTVQPIPAAAPLAQDPQAGQYGHAAIGAPVDQGAAMDRKLLAQSAADAAAKAPTTTQKQSTGLKDSTVAAMNSYAPLPIPQLAAGGMVRKLAVPHMVDGGGVAEAKRRADMLAKIPAGGNAPAPDGINTGNDFTRNVNNSLNALGGMGVVASVPLKAAAAVPSGLGAIRNAANAAPMLSNGVKGADFIAGASGVAKVGGANLPTVINSAAPVAKTTNVALQEGAKANQMAAGVRSFGNASAGAGMLDGQQAPVAPPVAQLPAQPAAPSLNAPWYSPEYAKAANASDMNGLGLERARRANPSDANDPLKNLILNGTMGTPGTPSAPGATPDKPAAPVNGRGQGYADPRQAAMGQNIAQLNDEFSNASIAQRNPGGIVRKVGNAYSGTNVSGDVSFQGADGNALPGRPGGGFMVAQGMSPEAIKSVLTNPDGSQWSAGDNAIMAANMRDGVDQYRGTSRDPRNDPMNQPMTKDQRAARVRMAETASQDKRYAQANAMEQEKLGMLRSEFTAKMDTQKQLADAQAEYLAAGDDPVKLKAAERKLMVLGGKQQAAVRAFAVPGGQGINADGTPYTMPSSVYDLDTRQFIQQGGPQGAKTAQQPAREVGKVYKDANGNRAKWDGKDFVPV